jgi:hypothetical protein
MYTSKCFEVPRILYWNLNNTDYDMNKTGSSFQNVINSMTPNIITSETTDRGLINMNAPYMPLFIRPEITQLFYNVINSYIIEKDKLTLNTFTQNFYINGINGMKNFDSNIEFQLLMESAHYNKMDIRFI